MSRPGVTYLEVAEAANLLLGQGKNPTLEQIRLLLGTGSSTTLSKHLRQWKKSRDHNQRLASKEHLPEELLALVKGLWERLVEESEERLAELETGYQTRVNELLPELQKYKNNNQRWQQLYHQWLEEKKHLSRDKAAAEKEVQQFQRESATFSEKCASLERQLEEKQERIQELQRLHQQAQTNLEHFRESTRTQRLMEQQRHEKEKRELLAQQKELKSHQTRLKNELSKREKQNEGQLQKAHHFKALYQELKQQHETENRKGIALQTEIRVLETQLTQAKQQRTEVLEENKRLSQEKWGVAKEKSQLEGQLKQLQSFLQRQEVKVID